MTDLARSTREMLQRECEIRAPAVVRDSTASDGTRKWLLDVGNGNAIEASTSRRRSAAGRASRTDENAEARTGKRYRGTLCISSQAGCALDCAFCSTGKQGFNRNLTVARDHRPALASPTAPCSPTASSSPGPRPGRHPITNVVMMGMGEPLANFDNVVTAMRIMLDDHGYGLSRRRVTLSTSGMVPALDRLREACPVALAVILHAPERRAARSRSCRSIASIRSSDCSRPACATSNARRATSSPSNTSCSTTSTTSRSRRASWPSSCATCRASST